jgi:hypothetical protein
VKAEANHWFRAADVPGPRFVIIPWDLSLRDPMAKELHLCGMACAVKAMTKSMERREDVAVPEGVGFANAS